MNTLLAQIGTEEIFNSVSNKNYLNSIGLANKFLDENNEDGSGYLMRAYVYHSFDKNEEALVDINNSIKQNPNIIDYYKFKVKILVALKKYSDALSVIEIAKEYVTPDDEWDLLECKIKYWLFLEDTKVWKVSELLTCIDNKGLDNTFDGCSLKARIYIKTEDYEKSIAEIDKAIQFDIENIDGFMLKGNILMHFEKYREAIIIFSSAIKMDSSYSVSYYRRGISRYYLKEYEQALSDFNKCIELENNDFDFYLWRAKAYWNLKDKDSACNDFRKASEFRLTDELNKYLKKCN